MGQRKKWHLDLPFPSELFIDWWPESSSHSLVSLFKHLDETDESVLSMLPEGVSPIGAAIAATFMFLPGISTPPKPHCRIALYPGNVFARHLREMKFNSRLLFAATQQARRAMRGSLKMSRPLEALQSSLAETESVFFHWMWKCERVFERYHQNYREEILPRNRFGRSDDYESTLQILEMANPKHATSKLSPFDLFIYCPYYHGWSNDVQTDLSAHVAALEDIPADRKLVIAKSPYDFWSRKLEPRLKVKGTAFPVQVPSESYDPKPPDFVIVDQLVNFETAIKLYRLIKRESKELDYRRPEYGEFRSLLKRFLVAIHPKLGRVDEESPSRRLVILTKALFPNGTELHTIIDEISAKYESGNFKTKFDVIFERLQKEETDIWVTKDIDDMVLKNALADKNISLNVTMCDRYLRKINRRRSRPVMLTRVDKESDLDLVAYLSPSDSVVMSSWEGAIIGHSIGEAWERSLRWRQNAKNAGLFAVEPGKVEQEDPVFELANFITSAVENVNALMKETKKEVVEAESTQWWHDSETRLSFDPKLRRGEVEIGPSGMHCLEVIFLGGVGVYLREGSDVQVIRHGVEAEIETISAKDLSSGDIMLLFKDNERESFFDILMSQLECVEKWSDKALAVKKWKALIKSKYEKYNGGFSSLAQKMEREGFPADQVVLRSWIIGPTMAPHSVEVTRALAKSLGVDELNIDKLHAGVREIRFLARRLGRVLNKIIVGKGIPANDADIRYLISETDLDLDEIRGAVEAREVVSISKQVTSVKPSYIRRLFTT